MHTFTNAEPPKVSFHCEIIGMSEHVLRSQAALKLKWKNAKVDFRHIAEDFLNDERNRNIYCKAKKNEEGRSRI